MLLDSGGSIWMAPQTWPAPSTQVRRWPHAPCLASNLLLHTVIIRPNTSLNTLSYSNGHPSLFLPVLLHQASLLPYRGRCLPACSRATSASTAGVFVQVAHRQSLAIPPIIALPALPLPLPPHYPFHTPPTPTPCPASLPVYTTYIIM